MTVKVNEGIASLDLLYVLYYFLCTVFGRQRSYSLRKLRTLLRQS